jgi:phenylalanyl-tRNA synthetase beta chain
MACYEVGRVFHRQGNGAPEESERLAIGLMGPVGRTGLDRRRPVEPGDMFLWIRGIWERVVQAQGLTGWSGEAASRPFLRDGWAMALTCRGQPRGCLGLVQPEIAATWRLSGPVAVLDVDYGLLLGPFRATRPLKPLTPYPSVVRDAAVVVPQDTTHEDVLTIIQKVAPEDLESVELFDIFSGQGVGEGKKSLAYSFTYRSLSRTLTDEDANRYHDAVKKALREELNAEIRES